MGTEMQSMLAHSRFLCQTFGLLMAAIFFPAHASADTVDERMKRVDQQVSLLQMKISILPSRTEQNRRKGLALPIYNDKHSFTTNPNKGGTSPSDKVGEFIVSLSEEIDQEIGYDGEHARFTLGDLPIEIKASPGSGNAYFQARVYGGPAFSIDHEKWNTWERPEAPTLVPAGIVEVFFDNNAASVDARLSINSHRSEISYSLHMDASDLTAEDLEGVFNAFYETAELLEAQIRDFSADILDDPYLPSTPTPAETPSPAVQP